MRMRMVVAAVVGLATVAVPVSAAPAAAADGPALRVDLGGARHAISPYIYGMNFADETLAADLRLPVRRWGGNATTLYDFRTNTTNRGSDWYFENAPGADGTYPDGSETDLFVEQDRRTGTASVLTLPLIGWTPNHDWNCGFSIAKYGPQQASDSQWRPDCGNGVRPDGTFVTGNDPHDVATEIDPGYVTAWLAHLTGRYGTAARGGVRFWNLDNEPDLWHATHRDVHPVGASYDELRASTYAYGAALKAADPGAKTLGPAGWGYLSLTMSGFDQETCNRVGGDCWSNPPDRAAHGGTPFGEWYLQQMAAYQKATGVRVLDYFDNHLYPQQSGVALGSAGDPATQALRLRSTRQLWDPTYTDESWINTPIQLIPRMRALVNANYPGTRTAIGEYNWGALTDINGALAQADVLGIFGREGLDLATLWAPPAAGDPGAYAFRMYRNYDGRGGRFGDQSIAATSGDQEKLSVYAARRSTDGALTLVVVNKSLTDDLTSPISFAGLAGRHTAQVYRYGPANLGAITRGADLPLNRGAATTTFPANTITTLVVR